MKNIPKLLLFTVFCTVMVNVTLSEKSDFVSNISILKLGAASANAEDEITCSRIKNFEECPQGGMNLFKITECEDYILVPPLVCDQCVTNDCH